MISKTDIQKEAQAIVNTAKAFTTVENINELLFEYIYDNLSSHEWLKNRKYYWQLAHFCNEFEVSMPEIIEMFNDESPANYEDESFEDYEDQINLDEFIKQVAFQTFFNAIMQFSYFVE